jgi:hypothetical protein
MALTNRQKRARNAEYQRRWQAKHKAELQSLRQQARAALPDPADVGYWMEGLIEALNRRPLKERARAYVHIGRRLGLEVEEVASHYDGSADTAV